jgi:hypothetical protein
MLATSSNPKENRMMNRSFAKFAAVAAVALSTTSLFAAARGTADFTRFVAIGDSYGAGFESNGLNERHQIYSWPAIIAKQVGLKLCTVTSTATDNCFAQPLVSYPGIGAELTLVNVAPTLAPAPGVGTPLVTAFGRPYNNLSIPGANVGDVTTITGAEAIPTRGVEQLARFILRGLGTEVDQAVAQHPTFIAVWIGGNDFLGAVTAATPKLLTPTATFKTQYNAMLDKLTAGAPAAGMVVGTLPTNPASSPFLNTIPPFIVNSATRQPVLGPDGKPIYYVADLGDGTFGQLPVGSFVTLPALAKIQTGQGIPSAFKTIPPFNLLPNVGVPLTDNDVITPAEAAIMFPRVAEYNTVITEAAAARNIPVADIKGLFDRFATNQVNVGPFVINSSFITGGIFSLDAVHLTDLGYAMFANQFIKAINSGYGVNIPLAPLSQFIDNTGIGFANANGLPITDTSSLKIDPATGASMLQVLQSAPAPAKRGRAAGH